MIIGIFVLVIACAAVAAGWGAVTSARRMRGFETTTGTVIGREVVATPGGAREGRWGRGGGYRPKVTYTYRVDGVEYTSDRSGYVIEGFKQSVARQRLDAVPDAVEVYYDPAAPQQAYLQKSTPLLGWLLVAGGLTGVLVSLVVLLG